MTATTKRFVSKNGLDNNANSIANLGVTGASLTQAGANSLTLTTTGTTNVTFPTSGTLATTTGSIANLSGGATGSVPYQSGVGSTIFLAASTNGYVLTLAGGVPTWAASTGGVTSITGTANQITASASTGAVTLSLPSNVSGISTLTTTGNIYAGGSANTWYSGAEVVQIGATSSVINVANQTLLGYNTYINSSAVNTYITTGGASTIDCQASQISFNIAPSGTAGNPATFTTPLAINAAGTVTANAGVAASSTATGTIVVTGGLGVSGTIYASGFNGPLTGNASTATTATNVIGGLAGSLPYQTAANTTTMLAAGTNGQVLTLASGIPSWAAAAGAGQMTFNPVIVATQGQTVFSVPSGYSAGMILVFINGVCLLSSDYTATNGTSITLNTAANAGEEVQTIVFTNITLAASSSIVSTTATATDLQATFIVSYTVNMLIVVVAGAIVPPSDYTATNGTTVVFGTALSTGTQVEFISFTAMNITNALNKTGDTITGIVNAPTPATTTNNNQLPTTAYVNNAIAANTYGINVIVNGDCSIAQVNGTTLITPTNNTWPIDMVGFQTSQISKIQAQQVTNKLNSLGATAAITYSVLSQYTPASTDIMCDLRSIEGFNFARFQYGTTNAKAGSLQFKATASVAGTYSGTIVNAAGTRAYGFTFTLSANTDTLIQILNIPGDTGGTWIGATSAQAAAIRFNIGSGSVNLITAGSWQTTSSGGISGVTGTSNLVSQVAGSTLSITDVQFEVGSVCTQFERKLYSQNLAECQRYYWQITNYYTFRYFLSAATYAFPTINIPAMRTAPTVSISSAVYAGTATSLSSIVADNNESIRITVTTSGSGEGGIQSATITASAQI